MESVCKLRLFFKIYIWTVCFIIMVMFSTKAQERITRQVYSTQLKFFDYKNYVMVKTWVNLTTGVDFIYATDAKRISEPHCL